MATTTLAPSAAGQMLLLRPAAQGTSPVLSHANKEAPRLQCVRECACVYDFVPAGFGDAESAERLLHPSADGYPGEEKYIHAPYTLDRTVFTAGGWYISRVQYSSLGEGAAGVSLGMTRAYRHLSHAV